MYRNLLTFSTILFILCAIITSCNKKTSFFATKTNVEYKKGIYPHIANLEFKPCKHISYYSGENADSTHFQVKTIKLNFHVLDSKQGGNNFDIALAKPYIKNLVEHSNKKLLQNQQMHLPINNNTSVLPIRIQFEIVPDPNIINDDGIYFHTDNDWYINKKAKKGNTSLYSNYLYKKYGVQKEKVLNVFMLEHHQDSLASSNYKNSNNGLGMPYYVKLVHSFANSKIPGKGFWHTAGLFNHEVGHSLGLAHSWTKSDGCDDTPPNSNCWNRTKDGPCKTDASNNLMDYNAFSNALTPCQIGKMHYNIMNKSSSKRKITKKDWCELLPNKDISINNVNTITDWLGSKDLQGNLIIERGAKLAIHCDISMPKDSKIIIKPGATLILNDSKIYNDCNLNWKGIEIQKQRNLKGNLIFYGDVKINNAENSINFVKS